MRGRSAIACAYVAWTPTSIRELVAKFEVEEIPALLLVVDRKVIQRVDGRAHLPQIEAMLEPYLPEVAPV